MKEARGSKRSRARLGPIGRSKPPIVNLVCASGFGRRHGRAPVNFFTYFLIILQNYTTV
jgi:hypothetical protein